MVTQISYQSHSVQPVNTQGKWLRTTMGYVAVTCMMMRTIMIQTMATTPAKTVMRIVMNAYRNGEGIDTVTTFTTQIAYAIRVVVLSIEGLTTDVCS
jgi:hypothetical protein